MIHPVTSDAHTGSQKFSDHCGTQVMLLSDTVSANEEACSKIAAGKLGQRNQRIAGITVIEGQRDFGLGIRRKIQDLIQQLIEPISAQPIGFLFQIHFRVGITHPMEN
jgi:hypothetical protein